MCECEVSPEFLKDSLENDREETHDRSAESSALHRAEKVDRDFVLSKAARDGPDDEPDHAADKDSA